MNKDLSSPGILRYLEAERLYTEASEAGNSELAKRYREEADLAWYALTLEERARISPE